MRGDEVYSTSSGLKDCIPVLYKNIPLPLCDTVCHLFQVHPLALCNDGVDDSPREYGWVGVVKLDRPEVDPIPCLTLYEKVS